jgi:hypothetical protein
VRQETAMVRAAEPVHDRDPPCHIPFEGCDLPGVNLIRVQLV